MKEPVLFKTRELLKLLDHHEIVVGAGEKRFVFLEIKNAEGISDFKIETMEDSALEIVVLQQVSLELDTLSDIQIKAGKNSSIKLTFVQGGGKLAHLKIDADVIGENAQVQIRGLQNARRAQKLSFEVNTNHLVPHSQSDLQVWCIASDEARSIFNGTITIEKGAHHTEAYQKNKNLLLSNRATIDTFPKLFIFNDDVKCAHGSSVSQLEPEQFYYLQSRGIGADDAEKMLLSGFMHQAFSWITNAETKQMLEERFGIREEGF